MMKIEEFLSLYGNDNGDAELKTPSYIFDIDILKARTEYLRKHLPGKRIVYAMKANPFIVGAVSGLVDAFEICSPGEERICEKAGIPARQMVLSGVNKEEADFRRIMEYAGAGDTGARPVYTAESMHHIEILGRAAGAVLGENAPVDVLLRVTSGNQFGMDEEEIVRVLKEREKYPCLHFIGIQLYSGTQKKLRNIEKEIAYLDALLSRLDEECGFRAEELEYGPGLPVNYFRKEKPVEEDELLRSLNDLLDGMNFKGRISLEMGRFFAACCGSYVTRIMDRKTNRGVNYLICDGGIHQVNYYGQMMAMKLPFMRSKDGDVPLPSETDEKYSVCGSLCTVSDVIVKEVPLHNPEPGDILVFDCTGAYSVTEGISLFLSRDLPRVYLRCGGEIKEARKQIFTEDFNYG